VEAPKDRYSESALIESGLSADEAKELAAWVEKGRPGVSTAKSSGFAAMYMAGFSIQEISAHFPEYPRAILLYSRVREGWDALRAQYQAKVVARALGSAVDAKYDALQLVSQIMQATNQKWRAQILRYMANPNEKAPDFLPDSLAQFSKLLEILREMTEPKGGGGQSGPIVNVNVGQGGEVRVVDPAAVKAALMADVGKKVG
jgi:hypothetical protein